MIRKRGEPHERSSVVERRNSVADGLRGFRRHSRSDHRTNPLGAARGFRDPVRDIRPPGWETRYLLSWWHRASRAWLLSSQLLFPIQRLTYFPMVSLNGSTTRPMRQPCSLPTGHTSLAPAATACSYAASGSSTTRMIRTVPPPKTGTEVQVLRRLVGDPEFGGPHGQLSDYCPVIALDGKQLAGPKGRLVECDRLLTVAYREHGSDGGLLMLAH